MKAALKLTLCIIFVGMSEHFITRSAGIVQTESELEDLVVLVVDDESLIAVMIEDSLNEGGFKSVCASSGERAVDQIITAPERFCALVTDINLGRGQMKGWDIARRARELTPGIPVVYITGDSAAEWTSHGVPGSILISKPFVATQILTAIANLMNHTTGHAT